MSLESRALTAIGLCVLAVIGVFLHLDSRRARDQVIDEKLATLVAGVDLAITNHEGAAHGLQSLLTVTPDLDAEAFEAYGRATLAGGKYPAVWALIWAEGAEPTSSVTSDSEVAIRFIVSDIADQASAVGFVLSDDPERLAAIQATAATGEPAFSRPTYVEDTDDWIISIYQAVFTETGELRGVAVATLDLDGFLSGLAPGLSYRVTDLGIGGTTSSIELHRSAGDALFSEVVQVERMGRVWEIGLGASEVPGPVSGRDLALIFAGLGSSLAAARLIASRERAEHQARREAEALADELRAALADEEVWRTRLTYAMRNADLEIWERQIGGTEGWSSGDWAANAPSMYDEFRRRLHPDDGHFVDRPEMRADGAVMETEFRFADDDGTYRWKLSRAAVIRRGGRSLLVGAQMDIDAQRRALDELDRVNHLLKESNEGMLEFTRVASHDMRSPLRNIHTLCEFIYEDHDGELPASIANHIERIEGQASRLMLLLDDLLDYSAANTKVEPRPTAVDEMVRNLAADLATGAGPSVEVLARVDGLVVLQPMPFATVVRNLIDNALKYHDHPDDGRVAVTVDIVEERRADAGGPREFVVVDVADDGPGIDPEYHERIFEPFQRLQLHGPADGSGVGLSVVRRMAETYGATIELESEPGRGTTFTVRWPISAAGELPAASVGNQSVGNQIG